MLHFHLVERQIVIQAVSHVVQHPLVADIALIGLVQDDAHLLIEVPGQWARHQWHIGGGVHSISSM
jgi:hypothetical protein